MPIIYSYPSKTSPTTGDLLLISDVSASNQTKKITIGDLKDPLDVVDSITATPPIQISASTGNVTISSRAYGGSLTTGHVPTGGSATTFLRGDGSWATPAGGGTKATADGGTGSEIASAAIYNILVGNGSTGASSAFVESGGVETAIQLPIGTTARRPTANADNVGLIRYNTETAKFEGIIEDSVGSGSYIWVDFTTSG